MTAIEIAAIMGCAATIVSFVYTSWRHRVQVAELGTMSQQWRSEQRAHERYDSQR